MEQDLKWNTIFYFNINFLNGTILSPFIEMDIKIFAEHDTKDDIEG